MRKTSAKPRPVPSPLGAYRQKRDPLSTNEPFSAEHSTSAGETWLARFVVHLHAASRRHYDLRLQVGSTLKSFAVPRGPSLNPADKRLAVQTEDHPLEYLEFEEVIPEGNYGAGAMIVWDAGSVRFLEHAAEQGLGKGKLDFELWGHKLRGRFALVETTQRQSAKGRQASDTRQWLLLKKSDVYCSEARGEVLLEERPESVLSGLRVEQLPERQALGASLCREAEELGGKPARPSAREYQPMLAELGEQSHLQDGDRIFELKLDGYRVLAARSGAEVSLRYRSGNSATHSFPEVVRALRALPVDHFLLDGELVCFDADGRPKFTRLATRLNCRRPEEIRRLALTTPARLLAFDLLTVGDWDVCHLPLLERKRLLHKLVPHQGIVASLGHLTLGTALFSFCQAQNLEGVLAKRQHSPYRVGVRHDDWVKVKCEQEADFVIVGWTQGRGRRGPLGAIDVASYVGDQLRYRGRVGTGLDQKMLQGLAARLGALEIDDPPFHGEPVTEGENPRYVKPELVVRVRYLEFTEEGRLRHPVFVRIVETGDPKACVEAPRDEIATSAPPEQSLIAAPSHGPTGGSQVVTGAAARAPLAISRGAERVQLSNLNKVFWPDEGYTKGDLLTYYAQVAEVLLPYLEARPVMLVRHPDGIAGKSFYQWNVPQGTPAWLRTLELRQEERDGKSVATFLVDDLDALLHVVNLGCIPIHVLACREQSLDCCDFLTIDFDLGPRPFRDAVFLALELRDLLTELGLQGFAKTSGQSGLHVLIPMGPGVPFTTAKLMVELLGRLLQSRHPALCTMERRVEARGDKLYIDTGQTGRSRTIVAPYSVRAYPGARVSTPLGWDELHVALDPGRFTMFSVPQRLLDQEDPGRELLLAHPDVPRAIQRLEDLIGRPAGR